MPVVRQTPNGFVLEEGGQPVGGVGFDVEPTCPPEFLGNLPPDELFLRDLWLPWDGDWLGAGQQLIPGALSVIAADVPDCLQVRSVTVLGRES